jgi:predicted CopG family antitoxin
MKMVKVENDVWKELQIIKLDKGKKSLNEVIKELLNASPKND